MRTHNIGHLLIHGPYFVNFYEYQQNQNKVYWFTDHAICNKFVLNVFKNQLPSIIRVKKTFSILRPHIRFILNEIQKSNPLLRPYIINTEDGFFVLPRKTLFNENKIRLPQHTDYFSTFNLKMQKTIEEQKVSERMQNVNALFKIPKQLKVVLVIDRDSNYRNEKNQSPRNTDPEMLNLVIEYLLNQNYFVIRFGNTRNLPVRVESENFIDYPFYKNKSELSEYYLSLSADYVISWNTGLAALPNFQGKKICFLEFTYVPPTCFYDMQLTPKSYRLNKSNREIHLPEILREYGAATYDNPSELKKYGLSSINLNFQAITDSINQYLNEELLSDEDLAIENTYFRDILESLYIYKKKFDKNLVPEIYENELLRRKNILSKEFCKRYSINR